MKCLLAGAIVAILGLSACGDDDDLGNTDTGVESVNIGAAANPAFNRDPREILVSGHPYFDDIQHMCNGSVGVYQDYDEFKLMPDDPNCPDDSSEVPD